MRETILWRAFTEPTTVSWWFFGVLILIGLMARAWFGIKKR